MDSLVEHNPRLLVHICCMDSLVAVPSCSHVHPLAQSGNPEGLDSEHAVASPDDHASWTRAAIRELPTGPAVLFSEPTTFVGADCCRALLRLCSDPSPLYVIAERTILDRPPKEGQGPNGGWIYSCARHCAPHPLHLSCRAAPPPLSRCVLCCCVVCGSLAGPPRGLPCAAAAAAWPCPNHTTRERCRLSLTIPLRPFVTRNSNSTCHPSCFA